MQIAARGWSFRVTNCYLCEMGWDEYKPCCIVETNAFPEAIPLCSKHLAQALAELLEWKQLEETKLKVQAENANWARIMEEEEERRKTVKPNPYPAPRPPKKEPPPPAPYTYVEVPSGTDTGALAKILDIESPW